MINVVLPVLGHARVIAILDVLTFADSPHDVTIVTPLADTNLVLFTLFKFESKALRAAFPVLHNQILPFSHVDFVYAHSCI